MEEQHAKKDRRSNSLWFLSFVLVLGALIEWSSYYSLPQQLRAPPLEKAAAPDFTVDRARANLKGLTAIGSRVTGSVANDYTTPIWLLDRLQSIQSGLAVGAKLELSLQTPSSSFYIDFLGGMNNVYSNVTNVVARLSWPGVSKDSSAVLVNAHFDSVPGSPGAADDGVGIAVMIEALESLSATPTALRRPIVFLFNGAEEWVHHGAHGFITQHPWARDIDYLINLEAIGSGGREMMFQCNSGQVAELYGQAAPYPQASVLAHELFKNFLYRVASTDWATFIQYGQKLYGRTIRGFDTAYVDNGYVYHTSFDKQEVVPDGTLLNTGENLVHVIRAMSEAGKAGGQDESAVFFDLFHLILVRYSGAGVHVVHWLAVAFGLGTTLLLAGRQLGELRLAVSLELSMFGTTLLTGTLLGVLAYCFFPMRWYNGGVAVSLLIFMPPLFLANLYYRGTQAETHLRVTPLLRILATLVVWVLQVLPLILLGVMTAYLGCLWIVSLAVSAWIYHFLSQRHMQSLLSVVSSSSSPKATAVAQSQSSPASLVMEFAQIQEQAYLVSLLPIISIWYKTINATLVMTLPLFGKSGTVVPSDIALGGLFAVLVALPFGSFLACTVTRRLPAPTLRRSLFTLVALYVGLAALTSSYSAARPKRLWVQSVERYYRRSRPGPARFLPKHLSTTGFSTAAGLGGTEAPYVMDRGLWVSAFDERGLDPLLPYLFDYVDRSPVTAASAAALRGEPGWPVASLWRHVEAVQRAYLSPTLYYQERNQDCNVGNGDCFFALPWYFPVPESLRHGVYLALPEEEGGGADKNLPPPLDERLRLQLSNVPVRREAVQIAECDVGPGPLRLVTVDLTGPSHMNLAVRDHNAGQRVHAWFSETVTSTVPARTPAEVLGLLTCASPARSEGVHYFHLGAGRCTVQDAQAPLLCATYRVHLLVMGEEEVEVAAYGHFVDLVDDRMVAAFLQRMPAWSRGSEWTRFPSVLVSDVV